MASRGRGGRGGRGGGRGGRGGGRGGGGGEEEEELGRTPRELNMIKTPAPTWPAYDNLPVHPEDISPEELSLYSKAALMRDFFKTSPFYLKKDKQAKEVKRFSTEKLQSEFRNPTLMEYLHPLFRIFPNEVLEDDQAKRRREALERQAKRRRMDMNFDLLAKLEQQGTKPKTDAPSHDLDEEALPGEEEEEETDYTTNFGDNDDDGDDGDDGGDDEPYI